MQHYWWGPPPPTPWSMMLKQLHNAAAATIFYHEPQQHDYELIMTFSIDVGDALSHAAFNAMSVIDDPTMECEVMQRVKDMLTIVANTQKDHYFDGDGLDHLVAKSLMLIDNLLYHCGVVCEVTLAKLRDVQHHLQDATILSCSRFVDEQASLLVRGISKELEQRFENAFTKEALMADDRSLWSRLGNAAYHIFRNGMKGQGHRRRPGRRHKPEMQTEAASDSGGDSKPPAPPTCVELLGCKIEEDHNLMTAFNDVFTKHNVACTDEVMADLVHAARTRSSTRWSF